MATIVKKLLMYGFADENSRDMTLGDVWGLNYYKENGNFIFEKLHTNVGFKEGSGFKRPESK
jgi:hypothetical protein